MGKYTKMSQQVLEKVGGLSNITFVERCATRLRIHYASKSKVDVEAIKGIEHVVGVVDKTGQVQIIIGPEVNDAFNDFLEVSGWRPTDDRPTVVEEEPEKKGFMYWVNKFGNADTDTKITKFGISFNSDGTTTFYAELEKSSASQKEYLEKIQEKKAAEKKEIKKKEQSKQIEVRKTTVQANSKEELLDKIKNVDWDSIKSEENKIGGRFDFSV